MKILIIGTSGRVGTALTHKLLKPGHRVTGTSIRSISSFDSPNLQHLQLELTEELEQMEPKIAADFEGIYFVAGSRADSLLEIDLHGAVKAMQIANRKA